MGDVTKRDCREAGACRSCGSLILWVVWRVSGKRMPVDVKPDLNGGVVLTYSPKSNELIADKFDVDKDRDRNRFTSHFATCIHANQHRKTK